MDYRFLTPDELEHYVPIIWRHEDGLPTWFKAARKSWTATEEEFLEFARSCWRIAGFFKDEKFVACVYIELPMPEEVYIHLSIIEKIDMAEFMEACARMRDHHFHEGIKIIRGWVLARNYVLARCLGGIGFKETGLRCDRGMSRGRILRWECMQVQTI